MDIKVCNTRLCVGGKPLQEATSCPQGQNECDLVVKPLVGRIGGFNLVPMVVPHLPFLVEKLLCNREKLRAYPKRLVGRELYRLLRNRIHYPESDYSVSGEAVLLACGLTLKAERVPVRLALFILPPMNYFLFNRWHVLGFGLAI